MSSINERLGDESTAQNYIRERLGPLVTLVEHVDSLYDRTIHAIADHPRAGSSSKVGMILTSRLPSDLRACSLTAQLGYGLQAMVLAGTIVELVGALSYVGDSDKRASEWANHKDPKHTYPRKVIDGIEATLNALGISEPSASQNWQEAYTFMCMSKHANPYLSLMHGMRIVDSSAYYVIGPDTSDMGIYLSGEALYNVVGFGTAGIYVAAMHCSRANVRAQLILEALSIRDRLLGLEAWFLEVIKPDWQATPNREKEAEALNAEAQRLQSEANRIRRETQKLEYQTRRVKLATRKQHRKH